MFIRTYTQYCHLKILLCFCKARAKLYNDSRPSHRQKTVVDLLVLARMLDGLCRVRECSKKTQLSDPVCGVSSRTRVITPIHDPFMTTLQNGPIFSLQNGWTTQEFLRTGTESKFWKTVRTFGGQHTKNTFPSQHSTGRTIQNFILWQRRILLSRSGGAAQVPRYAI